jgi:DNA-binding transcriptional regulator YhcF (GntR family)
MQMPDLLPLEKIRKKTVVAQVMDKIRELIASRQFKTGDRIPTEGELARMLGIGRSSIRKAIKVFNYLGVLDSQTAKGTFVHNVPRAFMYEKIEKSHRDFSDLSTIVQEHQEFIDAVKTGDQSAARCASTSKASRNGSPTCSRSETSLRARVKNRSRALIFFENVLHYTWFEQWISEEVPMRRTLILLTIVLFAASAVPLLAGSKASNNEKIECCRSGKGGGHGCGHHHGHQGTHQNRGSGKVSQGSQSGDQGKIPREKR